MGSASVIILGSALILTAFAAPQRCDKGSKVCQKLERDDPIFAGQRCEAPSDCKDEYNPYCSKWGYCISYNLFGEEGPGQSKGAVEDGTRGQCRTDDDCTPWAPSCSPLGYCRGSPEEWDWDGSFGSETNPKPGGPQSDWIKQNAKSGGARNDDYYKKIEDDNRAAHVKFRKDNPIFYEQIPELLPRLESIEKNVYEPCTYCTYDPKSDNEYQNLVSRLGAGNGSNSRKNKQNPRNNRRVQNNNRQNNNNNRRTQAGNGNSNKGRPAQNPRNNRRVQTNNNRQNNNRRTQGNGNSNKGRPQNNGNRRTQNNNNGNGRRQSQNSNGGGSKCPGGSLRTCKAACPKISARITSACESACAKRC